MAGERIELSPFSMFAATPVYSVDGNIVFGLLTDAVVPDVTDELWPVPAAGVPRLDLLSDAFYGTPSLWWVLALVNNILDPLVAVPSGTKLRVPTKDRLAAEGVINV